MRTRTLRALTGVLVPSLVAALGLLSLTGLDAQIGMAHASTPTVGPAPTVTIIRPSLPIAHGVLYGWGDNQGFGLGDGTTQNRTRPVPIPGMQDVVSVASGGAGGVAAKADGTLWTWGSEAEGQLGDGKMAGQRTKPGLVAGISHVVAVDAGEIASYALTASGVVYGWGADFNNELGDGSAGARAVPKRIVGLPAIRAIAAGEGCAMALATDGTVWGWGDDLYGGSFPESEPNTPGPVPIKMDFPTPVSGIGLRGEDFAITAGHIEGTGWDGDGNLGDNNPHNVFGDDVSVYGITDAAQVASSSVAGFARLVTGEVRAWGDNDAGQLGRDPSTTPYSLKPLVVAGLNGATDLAAGEQSVYALQGHEIYAWGANESGELGDGTTHNRTAPTLVTTLSGVSHISAGSERAFAIWN